MIGVAAQRIAEIALTVYADDGFVHQGVQGRNLAFLAKPYDLAVLARKVRTTLDS